MLALRATASKLCTTYPKKYRPPRWGLDIVGSATWLNLAQKVTVLNLDSRGDLVKRVPREREPVNIAMNMYNGLASKSSGY